MEALSFFMMIWSLPTNGAPSGVDCRVMSAWTVATAPCPPSCKQPVGTLPVDTNRMVLAPVGSRDDSALDRVLVRHPGTKRNVSVPAQRRQGPAQRAAASDWRQLVEAHRSPGRGPLDVLERTKQAGLRDVDGTSGAEIVALEAVLHDPKVEQRDGEQGRDERGNQTDHEDRSALTLTTVSGRASFPHRPSPPRSALRPPR